MFGSAHVKSLLVRLVQRSTPFSGVRLNHQVPLARNSSLSRKLAAPEKSQILCEFTCESAHAILPQAIHALVEFQFEMIGSVE